MGRVVHFEIPAELPERAVKFYSDVFGWQIQKWQGPQEYWLITTGPKDQMGIDGGILQRRDPSQPVIDTIAVESLDATVATIEKHGGKIIIPRKPIPGVGWLAYFKDTEGNMFGVLEPDANAK
jgi:predicted enzyme related to lactoylglutathione lyase